MTMAGVTEYPDLFAAGVNLFGMVNFFTFFQHTQPWMAAISTVEYGDGWRTDVPADRARHGGLRMNLLFFLILMVLPPRLTQTAGVNAVNVLRNANASEGMRFWNTRASASSPGVTDGNASIEQFEGNPCFVLRRGGRFRQTVSISEGHESLYVVFVGRVLSEYVHPGRVVTDRPYLYGLALGDSEHIL